MSPFVQCSCPVVEHRRLARATYLIRLETPAIARAIRASAHEFGANRLVARAVELEALIAGAPSRLESINTLLPALESEFDRALAALRRLRSPASPNAPAP